MDLIGDAPILSMADRDFRIFTRNVARPPQYLGPKSKVVNSLISEGCRINGTVINSILSGGVTVEDGAIIKDSVIMEDVTVSEGSSVYTAIVDADSVIEAGATVGTENASKQDIIVIGKGTRIKAENSDRRVK